MHIPIKSAEKKYGKKYVNNLLNSPVYYMGCHYGYGVVFMWGQQNIIPGRYASTLIHLNKEKHKKFIEISPQERIIEMRKIADGFYYTEDMKELIPE